MTDKTMTLEPCPFCGGDSFVLMIDGTSNFAVVCQYTSEHGCGMRGPYRQTEQEAITAWNTRHLSQPAERGEAQEKTEPVAETGRLYVEARQCEDCDHLGINDSSDTVSACGDCEWQGPTPNEDKCPGCARHNCMAVACPICGGRYRFLADRWFSHDTAPPPAAGVPDGVALAALEKINYVHLSLANNRVVGGSFAVDDETCCRWMGALNVAGARLEDIAMLSATPSPTIDVAAVRELIKDWRVMARTTGNKYERESLAMCAEKLAHAIGDAK